MNYPNLLKYVCFIIGLCLAHSSICQANLSFAEILINAKKEYEAGRLQEAASLATSCSLKNTSISDRWKAQRLLALIYIADNEPELARKAAESMLELNPTYKPNYLNDPAELIKLIKSIVVIPKFSLGLALSVGTNTTLPVISKSYVLGDYSKKYKSASSFQLGATVGYCFNRNMSAEIGLQTTRKVYSIEYVLPYWNVEIEEKLTYIELPLLFKYSIMPGKKLNYFVQGGTYVGYLISGVNNFYSSYAPSNESFEFVNVSSLPRRNRWNIGLVLGGGVSYKIKEGQLFTYINYYQSFSDIVNPETRYRYNELVYNYFYLDDDISLNNFSIGIGYSFFLNYKVIKKRTTKNEE